MKKTMLLAMLSLCSLLSTSVFADTVGAVKVECWGRCDLVSLGQVCDSYRLYSEPVALACDETDVGSGWSTTCGNGVTCRPYGTMIRSDLLSAYCADSGGYDAVVTCKAPATLNAATDDKYDDGSGQVQTR